MVDIDKGYLKEHAIGALKITHKVLGDIIEDHAAPEPGENLAESSKKEEVAKNVISISKLVSKRDK